VKSIGVKFDNDQIFDMANFDETSRRIEWSKNEFSHRLSLHATRDGRLSSASRLMAFPPACLNSGR
jgi:hypothetical protein